MIFILIMTLALQKGSLWNQENRWQQWVTLSHFIAQKNCQVSNNNYYYSILSLAVSIKRVLYVVLHNLLIKNICPTLWLPDKTFTRLILALDLYSLSKLNLFQKGQYYYYYWSNYYLRCICNLLVFRIIMLSQFLLFETEVNSGRTLILLSHKGVR